MRALPVVLSVVAAVAVVEVAVNFVFRPQVGPPALAAVFEPHLLALGVAAAVLAVLLTLGERGAGGSRIRLLAVVVIVVGVVRLGGEWWSPAPASGSASSSATPIELRVLSWNLELGSKDATTSVSGILTAEPKPDLVALQELTPDTARTLEADAAIAKAYPYRILEPRTGVAGMGLLSRYPLVVGSYETGPVVQRAGLLLPDGSRVELFNVHPFPPGISTLGGVPWGLDTRRRDGDLAAIADAVAGVDAKSPVLLVGDLNTTPFEPGFAHLADTMADAHSEVGTGTGFTWRPSSLEPLQVGLLRLDHVMTSPGLRPLTVAEDCSLPGDHCRLSVTLETVSPAH